MIPHTRLTRYFFLIVSGSTQNLHEFPPGANVELPLWKILEFVGLSLDDYAEDDGSAGGGDIVTGNATESSQLAGFVISAQNRLGVAAQPKLRVKGLQISAKMQYYNYHQAPGFEKQKDGTPGETVCILSLSPQDMWAAFGNDVSHFPSKTTRTFGTYRVFPESRHRHRPFADCPE